MQQQTEDILTSFLGSDFKVQIDKQDKILASMNNQQETILKEIEMSKKELDELTAKNSSLQDDIKLAYLNKETELKTAQDNFETSKSNSTAALDAREKNLEDNQAKHEANVQAHLQAVNDLGREKSQFETKKKAIVETLTGIFNSHNEVIKDALNVLNEKPEESAI
jgi:chromosome segregation ATPase